MSVQFLSKLSQNYTELLNDNDYYDITIEVGKDPDVKIFRAHMNILCCRSPYLRRFLASNANKKSNDNNVLAHVKLPNISPEVFQIILKYIYGGILSLSDQDTFDIIRVISAADELLLQELIDYLQKYLIENKFKWMEQHFELTHRTSFQSNSLLELQKFCTDFMAKSPEKIFKSFDFTSLPEKSLVQLIKRDDLQMKEIEVWDHALKWGLAQNPTLISDPSSWSDDDFKTMENTLQHCLPLIRFFSLSSKEFLQKIHPYKKLLKHQLYEDLLNFHLDPDNKSTNNNILPPRNIKSGETVDSKIASLPPRNIKSSETINSKIVSLNIISTISRFIPRLDLNNNFAEPYKFELLLRGSRDGFTPKKFHELCNGKHNTITFMKVKGTEEIIGGYNPLEWNSSGKYGRTKDSFIFSFKNENNFIKDVIISNVENTNYAVYNNSCYGPYFGEDIIIYSSKGFTTNYNETYCRKEYYEKKIRDSSDPFSIEDYEVFQIIKR